MSFSKGNLVPFLEQDRCWLGEAIYCPAYCTVEMNRHVWVDCQSTAERVIIDAPGPWGFLCLVR